MKINGIYYYAELNVSEVISNEKVIKNPLILFTSNTIRFH